MEHIEIKPIEPNGQPSVVEFDNTPTGLPPVPSKEKAAELLCGSELENKDLIPMEKRNGN